MTPQVITKATLTTPVDLANDQVTISRSILKEMNDRADRAIDDQVARSTPMMSSK